MLFFYLSGIKPVYRKWRCSTIAEIIRVTEKNSRPEDRILSFEIGLPALTGRNGIADFETIGIHPIAERLPVAQRRRLHLLNTDDLKAVISAHIPQLIVGDFDEQDRAVYKVEEYGYSKLERVGVFDIYKREPKVTHYPPILRTSD